MALFDEFLKQVEASKHYLLEVDAYDASRQNTVADSDMASGSVWQGTRTLNTTEVQGVFAANSAVKCVENTATQTHVLTMNAPVTVGQPNLVSYAVNTAGSRDYYNLYARSNGFSNTFQVAFNIRTQKIINNGANNFTIVARGCDTPRWLPVGWVRIWAVIIPLTAHSTILLELGATTAGGSPSYTGDGVSKFYIDAVHVEPLADQTFNPLRKVGGVLQSPQLRTLTFSTQGFITNPNDPLPSANFLPRIKTPLMASRSMYSSGRTTTRSVPQYGDMELDNTDGGLDGLTAYAFDGRDARVYLGTDGFAQADYGMIFKGKVLSLNVGRQKATIKLRDVQEELNTPLQTNRYTGAGGNEGAANLKDAIKPLAYGRCYNITPVIVNAASLKFQVNDGRINDILAVYDNGATIPPANYTKDLANGYFTLTNTPVGAVTCDVEGHHNGTTWPRTVGALIQTFATRCGVLASEMDTAAFSALDTLCPQVVGAYITDDSNALDVLDKLARSVGAFYGTNRQGLLTCGRLNLPTGGDTEVASFDESNILRDGIDPLEPAGYVKKVVVNYRKNWTQQSADSLAGIVATDPNAHAFKTGQTLTASATNAAVLTAHPYAEDLTFDTLLVDGTDALNEATRLLSMYGVPPAMFKVVSKAQPYALSVNDVVKLTHSRFGLSGGRKMRVLAINERSSRNEIELTLWG